MDGRTVSAYLEGVPYDVIEAGSLVSVKIYCHTLTASADLIIARTGEENHLAVRVEHKQYVTESSVRIEPWPVSTMVRRQLDLGPHDRVFHRTLQAAGPLISAARS
jgi:hypothetical protein